MEIQFNQINDTLYINLNGELDEYSASFTRNLIDEKILDYSFSNVVFDLNKLEFMDSTGIGVLIGRYKYLKKKNKHIYVSNPSQTIEKIFKMSGLYEIMPKLS